MLNHPLYGIKNFQDDHLDDYFYCSDLKSHLATHKFINEPHKHDTFLTVFFTQGKGEHTIDFTRYEILAGSVFLLMPGQVHSWKLSSNADGFIFFHSRAFFDDQYVSRRLEDFPFFGNHPSSPLIQPNENEVSKIYNQFNSIKKENQQSLPFKRAKLTSLVDNLYIELSRIYREPKTEIGNINHYFKLRKLEKLIDENYKTLKQSSDYAELMNITPRHLNRIVHGISNKTTGDLIRGRIILEAKRNLVQKDTTVGQVADELGYSDYSYFIRLFKKETGMSPRQFQNLNKRD